MLIVRLVRALAIFGLIFMSYMLQLGLQRVTGFTTDTYNYEIVKDQIGRLATQVDASWFATGWGEHVLKAGVK